MASLGFLLVAGADENDLDFVGSLRQFVDRDRRRAGPGDRFGSQDADPHLERVGLARLEGELVIGAVLLDGTVQDPNLMTSFSWSPRVAPV